ncbi:MAG: hypothetical protein RLZZ08_63 [Pseudomonadota bacterium]|jgi:cell wall-associated NlpC family hydrolase
MIEHRSQLARAAEAFVGVPFRFGGREPATGLDCVGLVLAALKAIGRTIPDVPSYRLRQTSIDRFLPLLPECGFTEIAGDWQPGDVVLVAPGPAQHHLLVRGSGPFAIHAHAGLRRISMTPTPLPWPTLRNWRIF